MKILTSKDLVNNPINNGIFNGKIGNVEVGELRISDQLVINESGIFVSKTDSTETLSIFANTGEVSFPKIISSVSGSGDGTLTLTRENGDTITTSLAHSHSEYLTSAPVDSVNGKTGAVSLDYNDVGALADHETATNSTEWDGHKIWTGTQSEYDAISTPASDTIYFIT